MTSPIEHVVIIVKENHTFDSYFGTYPHPDAQTGAHVDGDATLAHSKNPPDPMEEGVLEHGPWLNRNRTARREQFTEEDIPKYFEYAKQFTLCDHFFSEIAGPSGPNHLMLIAAHSPVINNPTKAQKKLLMQNPIADSLPALMVKKGLTWRNYSGYMFPWIKDDAPDLHTHDANQFANDAAKGDLPSVSWVYARIMH